MMDQQTVPGEPVHLAGWPANIPPYSILPFHSIFVTMKKASLHVFGRGRTRPPRHFHPRIDIMKRCFSCLSLWALVIAPASLSAQVTEPIRFARTPDISPDGQTVVFSYLGDLWLVDAKGGVARHLTMHEKHDVNPVFSPDGQQIAFTSNRHGQYDVFVIPTRGGRPTRVTFDSADDQPNCWSADGKSLLISSARGIDFPFRWELFKVPAGGGRTDKISAHEGREGALSPDGKHIAYVRGPGAWYRKGYRGSSNDDIWICDADGSNNRQLTTYNGQDNSPMSSADGKAIYYVTDQFGNPTNLVRQELTMEKTGIVKGPLVHLTHHKEDGVRRARISRNGQFIVYECGADLCILSLKDNTSRKLAIEVLADDKTNPDKLTTFTANATDFALSADEKHIAFVVHGEIFLMPRNGGKAKRLTDHPAYDHGLAWAPDGKRILFLSDRNGHEDLYAIEADDPEHPELTKAHRFKVTQLTKSSEGETGASYSPDGKVITFLRGGKLMVIKPDGTAERVLHKDGMIFDYEWSPDSQWIAYARQDNHFASEIFMIPANGATPENPARNLTRFATYNGGITWSRTGNKLAFISQRRPNQPSVFVLALNKPAAAGTAPSKTPDWDNIHLRVKQPTTMISRECAISSDGARVAFRGSADGDDLWVASTDGGQVIRLTTGNQKPTQITWSKVIPSLIYFRDGNGAIRTATLGAPIVGPTGINLGVTLGVIPFQAKMTIRQDEVFAEMFEQSWRALNESFYDPAFHGANWNSIRDKYRPLVKHCALKEDLYTLITLMLGELNASHLGIGGNLGGPEQLTADLGLLFDPAHPGPGLKIAEIIKGGPADQTGLNLKTGDIVLSLDGADLNEKTDLSKLLNDKVGEVVTLKVSTNPEDPKSKRRVEIIGANRQLIANLMYERWLAKNAARVTELSKGKLGYIHIPSMDEAGLDRFLRSLFSDNFDKDAIILDVRFNGGGFTHEQVLSYLGGKEHTYFFQRHGGQGMALNFQDRRWTKPLVLLQNNRSYSDAEIFPHAFRALGLGKLVGQPTGGHVIGTRSILLVDGSSFRTPRVGVVTNKGVNMEKEGVSPDVLVEVHPDQLSRGQDAQLDRAVDVLLQEVETWKKTRPPVSGNPITRNPLGSGLDLAPTTETPAVMPPAKD